MTIAGCTPDGSQEVDPTTVGEPMPTEAEVEALEKAEFEKGNALPEGAPPEPEK